ncbi:hypothetical protein ABIA14_003671 [Sinorhizobium fredii]
MLAAGAAAKRQHQRETGGTEHEDEAGNARQQPPDRRPFDEAEDRQRAHAEIGGAAPIFRRNALEAGKHQPRRKRHVEEDMGNQDAEQTVDTDRLLQAQGGEPLVQKALATPDLDQAERGDKSRQAERQGHQPQHPDPAGEGCLARQRA